MPQKLTTLTVNLMARSSISNCVWSFSYRAKTKNDKTPERKTSPSQITKDQERRIFSEDLFKQHTAQSIIKDNTFQGCFKGSGLLFWRAVSLAGSATAKSHNNRLFNDADEVLESLNYNAQQLPIREGNKKNKVRANIITETNDIYFFHSAQQNCIGVWKTSRTGMAETQKIAVLGSNWGITEILQTPVLKRSTTFL